MPIEIIVPRLGWSMEEGAFVAWLKKDGEFVQPGDPLFSIEGDKAVQEVEAIDRGILRIAPDCPKPGAPVRVGDVLGHLVQETESLIAPKQIPPAPTAAPEPLPARISPATSESAPQSEGNRPPRISPRALRLANELGIEWKKLTGSGRTGRIREKDVRAAAAQPEATLCLASFEPVHGPTVLVTGGCGFIGTWVVRELLQQRARVIVLDSEERRDRWKRVIGSAAEHVPLVKGSLLDRGLLARIFEQGAVTHIIHLAAMLTPPCQADPWEGCRVNVLGSVALFEQARSGSPAIKGFSYASSAAVFADSDNPVAVGESASHPITFYGAYKKAVELIAEQYWRYFKIPSIGIRPQVAYGPERDAGLTAGPSLAARAAALGRPFTIDYTGRIGYDYAEDVARAFVRGALETPPGACVVDLPGEVVDVADVLAAIQLAAPESAGKLAAGGERIPNHIPSHPRFISTLYPGWKTTSLREGMRRTVEFYKSRSL